MKPIIKINFVDFWPGFKKEDNYFTNLLSDHYQIELTDKPDFLFFSVYGHEYTSYDCVRVFYTPEKKRPNFYECDFAFSFDYEDYGKRNFRLPNYVECAEPESLIKDNLDVNNVFSQKIKFCNFVVSNVNCKERIEFFKKLSMYKKVDSGGRVFNNVGGQVKDKLAFIKDYKFTIAFENCFSPGYTTEKLLEPMLCHSLPIYWGNPFVYRDFNTKSFINCHDFKNFDEVIERIIEIDNNDELYKKYLSEPYFNNTDSPYMDKEKILKQFAYIFSRKDKIRPVARTWKKIGFYS
ncbi:MAG TPA: glycosyltransferase [Candidatus Omnitrophica bacterium]|nr:MAG: hypothetical protein A2Z81_08790 [Omnitrophica WOR_2 bacterium GWA2_45_18]HBR15691.1 glycosyltransferase [Candidatus Omnitrophota bacterium]